MTHASGIITEDPAINSPVGTQLFFNTIAFPHNLDENNLQLSALNNWEFFQGVLLSIHFNDHNSHSVEGSGVLVAPGIAFSAKHVFEPYADQIMNGKLVPTCMTVLHDGLQIWNVRKVNFIQDSDLVILGLTLASKWPSDSSFNFSMITTRLPKVGEKLLVAGFRASELSFERSDSHNETVSGAVYVNTGEITERYPKGRDIVRMPWPVLEIKGETLGGMSGGPVFDSAGLLVGLVCSGIEGTDISYVSLLFPAIAKEIEGGWPESLFQGKSTLLEMDSRMCNIDRRSALIVNKDVSNGTQTLTYEIWE